MSRSKLASEIRVCEAFGCFAKAEIEIAVKVGKGTISLQLCKYCVSKFKED